MTLTTIQNVCGNGFCQAGESFSNCAADCAPAFKDYVTCVINNEACKIPSYTGEISTFVFFLFLIGLFMYLKRKKII
jgi:hypothetical protein